MNLVVFLSLRRHYSEADATIHVDRDAGAAFVVPPSPPPARDGDWLIRTVPHRVEWKRGYGFERPVKPANHVEMRQYLDADPASLTMRERQAAVTGMMQHAWRGYAQHAWGEDELK